MVATRPYPWPAIATPTAAPTREECLAFYRKLTAGVTVVTSTGINGYTGLTASAVTSVSLAPPVVLCCIAAGSRTLAAIRHSRGFAVHLLRDEQEPLARGFAARESRDGGKFSGSRVRHLHGQPVLADALAWSLCRLESLHPVGDHVVVLGRVVATEVSSGQPLVWHERAFFELARPAAATAA